MPDLIPVSAGIGLRHPHLHYVAEQRPQVSWFEVHSENFFALGGAPVYYLERIRQHYPIAFHGTGLSLGSAQPPNPQHLQQLKVAIERFQPLIVSEHLSWSAYAGQHFNDLLPLPYTDESFAIFCDNLSETQDYLGCQLLIENPSSYGVYAESHITEWDFYSALPGSTGCALLLDLNNVQVNAHNHSFDPQNYFNSLKAEDVHQYHLAGHSVNTIDNEAQLLIDDHGSPVSEGVWQLYDQALARIGSRPTLIEWDSHIPDFAVLLAEADRAQRHLDLLE